MTESEDPRSDPRLYRPDAPSRDDVRARIPLASYRAPENDDEVGNPWLLALERPIESKGALRDRLTRTIDVDETDRNASRMRRTQLLLRQLRFIHPLGSMRVCYEQMVLAMFEGYATRNPLRPSHPSPSADALVAPATGIGFVVVGRSGVGKSTVAERSLSLIPGVIEHVSFEGRPFSRYQIPWLKMNCGSNSKEFCENLIREVDRLLGTSYHADLCTPSTPRHKIVGYLLGILDIHGLGLLCIDDVQNLFIGNSADQAQIVETLVRIVNILKIPLVVLGTEEAMPIFQIRFDTARRLTGLPTIVIHPLEEGPEWISFCERLWGMRVVRMDGPMPADFAPRLLGLSRGITDFAVKLVLFAQHRALAFKMERLDVDLLAEVYEIAIILVRDKLKNLGDDPFENYGEEHRDALDAGTNRQVLAALAAIRKVSAATRATARRQGTAEPALTARPAHAIPAPVSGAATKTPRKAKKSGKGGVACALAIEAQREGKSVHQAMADAGLIWRLGDEAAAA